MIDVLLDPYIVGPWLISISTNLYSISLGFSQYVLPHMLPELEISLGLLKRMSVLSSVMQHALDTSGNNPTSTPQLLMVEKKPRSNCFVELATRTHLRAPNFLLV